MPQAAEIYGRLLEISPSDPVAAYLHDLLTTGSVSVELNWRVRTRRRL